jgi:hypothetical protein
VTAELRIEETGGGGVFCLDGMDVLNTGRMELVYSRTVIQFLKLFSFLLVVAVL